MGGPGFSGTVLHALVTHPPKDDPLMISYAEGHLLLAGMTIRCTWAETGRPLVQALENPQLLDLLALEHSLPRVEARSKAWRAKTGPALKDRDRRIRLAAKHLRDSESPRRTFARWLIDKWSPASTVIVTRRPIQHRRHSTWNRIQKANSRWPLRALLTSAIAQPADFRTLTRPARRHG